MGVGIFGQRGEIGLMDYDLHYLGKGSIWAGIAQPCPCLEPDSLPLYQDLVKHL